MKTRPLMLIVLDGWGHREATENNAIAAKGHTWGELLSQYPHTLLSASGKEVGLPLGLMGNSEVGHMNLGAGRVVYQDITRIDKAIEDGELFENGAFVAAMDRARSSGKALHLIGLVGEGGVHASHDHIAALLKMAAGRGLAADQVRVHAITDGRDTPPRSGAEFVRALEEDIRSAGVGRIATVVGRYHAMDRDKRWERVQRAYDLYLGGRGTVVPTAAEALSRSYADDVSDEFVEPCVVGSPDDAVMNDGDEVLCFNFRADRMRQLVMALSGHEFDGFERARTADLTLTTMTQYRADFPFAIAFPPRELRGTFGEVISEAGLRQLRLAETEKYAHVSFFFSGGIEAEWPGERRDLIPSPKVATYDLKPEMSAFEVKDTLLRAVEADETDVYVVNFANADMVGHTGMLSAAELAVTAIDQCLREIVPAVVARGGMVAITADHGNAELMWDERNDQPHTAHTTNPVPIVFCSEDLVGAKLRPMGILADVAPTLLRVAGLEASPGMDGASLFAE